VILRDEKNASQGEDKTERNKEREGKQKREKQAPETKPLFWFRSFLNDFFLLFINSFRVCQRIIISLQNYISSLKEPRTPSQHGSAFAR
jgi:hypothetical protein